VLLNNRNENIQGEPAPIFRIDKEKAFASFFQEYYTALCFFANNILHNEDEAKDIVQDSFVKLWNTRNANYQSETVRSFLYAIVRNGCLDALKKRRVMMKAEQELKKGREHSDTEQFDEITHAEIIRQVFGAIDVLPSQMQKVFKLYYMEGKNYKEIASALNTSSETVRKQRTTALKIIRQKLLSLLLIFFFYL
jgi:RNA polymerase sigma-70 factor (ECF subfamily)